MNRPAPNIWAALVWSMMAVLGTAALAAPLSDPEVNRFNLRVGTQTFGPKYQFTAETSLVETAQAIQEMGSDVIKFYMGRGFPTQYGIALSSDITNLTSLAQYEPSCRRVFDMPFRHFVVWTYCFSISGDAYWKDGITASERLREYSEIHALARHFLTQYNNSGKSFYFGHWEGDWYLLPNYNTATNPAPAAIQGMIDWLNIRQQAVDDAMRLTPHTNVHVYAYAEVNRVRDAMLNGPETNQRLVNTVLPAVTNLDYVSWSSYDGQNLSQSALFETLDYIQSNLSTNKAALLPGRRVWVGEYGWGGSLSSAAQEPPTRAYIQKLLQWGCPFILFWEMYDNEGKAFWLIDNQGTRTPCYHLHQRFYNLARLRVAQFKQDNGRLPTDPEWADLLWPALNQPLPEPVSLTVLNGPVAGAASDAAKITGTVEQGIYGENQAVVSLFWGRSDGGTNSSQWEHQSEAGVCNRFGPVQFHVWLTNLQLDERYYFRFFASHSGGGAWAPATASFVNRNLVPNQFAKRLKMTFAGYRRPEPLIRFPALVKLDPNLAGFDYGQFASPNGADLRFTDASGLRLIPHEVDEWNTNGVSFVWVQLPELSGPNDCLWAYWGNPAAAAAPADTTNSAVWLPQYQSVWHLRESGFPYGDSTGSHPALSGNTPTASAGLIGGGQGFNGTDQYLDTGLIPLGDQFTLSAWIRVNPLATSIQTVFGTKEGGAQTDGLALFVNSYQSRDQRLLFETGNGTSGRTAVTASNAVPPLQWHLVAAVVDRPSGQARLYVDGQDRTDTATIRDDFGTSRLLRIGRFPDGGYPFRGLLDEMRLGTTLQSSNWIWAHWMNVASNEWFITASPVETPPINTAASLIVPAGAVWNYYDQPNDLGSAWRRNPFDDTAWKRGEAQLGFGDGDEATLIASNRQWTTYFRHEFPIADPSLVQLLSARLLRDDGAVVYLNGTEVWRSNMTNSGPILYNTPALTALSGTAETAWQTNILDPSLLISKTNLLAVEVHQNQLTSSDVSFDFALEVVAETRTSPTLSTLMTSSNLILAWPAEAGFFTVYSTSNLSPPVLWFPAPYQPVLSEDLWTMLLPQPSLGQRFYRLQTL